MQTLTLNQIENVNGGMSAGTYAGFAAVGALAGASFVTVGMAALGGASIGAAVAELTVAAVTFDLSVEMVALFGGFCGAGATIGVASAGFLDAANYLFN